MAYTTLAEVRAMASMDDSSVTDAEINDGIAFAEELIDNYTGTSWEHRAFTVTVKANGKGSVALKDDQGRLIMFPQTITSVTEDGVAVDYSGWELYPEGLIVRDTGAFLNDTVISGTAGITAIPPVDIRWAARTIARQYVVDLDSRIPDRALNIQTEFGHINLAQPGNHPDRPTSLPEVNARLSSRRQRPPAF